MTYQMQEREQQLNAFDAQERRQALTELVSNSKESLGVEGTNVNMHMHSFFSYNADDFSPLRIAWEARKAGLYAAGLCDFDVLDGVEEFLDAGLMLGLRTSASIETRAYLKEYADVDINSPGEPGVTYVMGAGFTRQPENASGQATELAGYRVRAGQRNMALLERINQCLPDIAVDYEKDVRSLTPSGSATERHIVKAYINRAKSVFKKPVETATFWARVMEMSLEATVECMADNPLLEETVRARLVKRGGLGYEQPSTDTFPPVDEFFKWVESCEAIPMMTWLDGTSEGEKDGRAMLECMMAKGAASLNIIPDRNWNINDREQRAVKTSHLRAIIETAEAMELPINIGTEMNKHGLPFVDDLDGEYLAPFKDIFLRGARIMVGHTRLLRYADCSYIGEQAEHEFANLNKKNRFFESVGAQPPLDVGQARELEDMGKEKAFSWLAARCSDT